MSQSAFRELISPFLRGKLADLQRLHGADAADYQALTRQYVPAPEERVATEEANLRHYEADLPVLEDGRRLPGVERLYRRTLVVEPTLACAAHCRYCIRANYPRHDLAEDELDEIARYCGHPANRQDLTEVLVTGGDPLLVPHRVEFLIDALARHAPNIRVVRIATRVPLQASELVNDEVMRLFERRSNPRIELATQINHPVELFPEVVGVWQRILESGARIYAQNVLLRGVNDQIETLVGLYDALRELGVDAHYLFHCVPLAGMGHLRTSLKRSIELGTSLACGGAISGRAKPLLAAMTDIGKIVLYDGAVLKREGRLVLLQSRYRLDERRRWNVGWCVPPTAGIDEAGYLRVWYLDGQDEPAAAVASDHRPARRRPRTAPALSSAAVAHRQRPLQLPVVQQCG